MIMMDGGGVLQTLATETITRTIGLAAVAADRKAEADQQAAAKEAAIERLLASSGSQAGVLDVVAVAQGRWSPRKTWEGRRHGAEGHPQWHLRRDVMTGCESENRRRLRGAEHTMPPRATRVGALSPSSSARAADRRRQCGQIRERIRELIRERIRELIREWIHGVLAQAESSPLLRIIAWVARPKRDAPARLGIRRPLDVWTGWLRPSPPRQANGTLQLGAPRQTGPLPCRVAPRQTCRRSHRRVVLFHCL